MDGDKRMFYLERVGESSRRSRTVFYILLVSSAMIFAFAWKMSDRGWIHRRIEIRREILNNWDQLVATDVPPPQLNAKDWARWKSALLIMHMPHPTDEDKKIIELDLDSLNEQWDSPFKVPFMDVTFDVNDFFFFSTLELLILAVIFLHCIVREEENLQIFFNAVQREGRTKLKECYEMASMLQIWTIPQGLDRFTESILRLSIWPIFFFPVLVELWVFLDDRASFGSWDILGKSFGDKMRFCDRFLFFALCFVTAWSAVYFVRMNRCWDDIQQKVAGTRPIRE